MKQELHKLRRQNGALDSERHEHNKTLNHLRTRIAVLEQEVKDKEQVCFCLFVIFLLCHWHC